MPSNAGENTDGAGGGSAERVGLSRLWAGWRGSYIEEATADERAGTTAPEHRDRCPFCRILESGLPDEETYIVWRGGSVFAILNAYPYATGHLLVLPYRHVGELHALSGEEADELWRAAQIGAAAVKAAYTPDGLNIGANLGRAAGAGVPGHLHMHVVPRWNGDTNFMTTTAETRVMPEPLAATWRRLTRQLRPQP